MKSIVRFPSIDRRILLSSLAMLPVLPGSLRLTPAHAQSQRDPLPSWNDSATKASILDFVARVTTQNGPYFVPVEQRIAPFDNDGTLWVEQPMYVQLAFALDRVKVMAPLHPDRRPYRAAKPSERLDNYAAHKHPKVRQWLDRHERFAFHFTPTSCSWLNAVEGFFATLTKRRLKRGVFHSIFDLQASINRFLKEHNMQPKPFVWTADPDKIIAAVRRGHQMLDSIH